MLPFRNQEGQNPFSASSRIRGDWLANYMPELTIATPEDEKEIRADIKKANEPIVIFQKRFLDTSDIELGRQLKAIGKKIIFDLCDSEWAHPGRIENLRHMMDIADAMTSSTKFVADWLSAESGMETIVIPDRIDLEQHELTPPPENRPLILGWFGNKLTVEYIKDISDEIIKAMHKQPDIPFQLRYIWECDYDFTCCGLMVEHVKWELDTANEKIAECDIILNPHKDDAIGKGKSNNKTLTAWALGRPVIEENFALELSIYLGSQNLRMASGLSGRKNVLAKYDVKESVEQLREVIKSL